MILVATDCVRDFYKCRYCRHIEEREHTHLYECTDVESETHKEVCVCGDERVIEHEYSRTVYYDTIDPTGRFAQCRYCGTLYRITGFTPIIRYNIPEEIAIE